MSVSRTKRRFQLVLITPSHYDDEGYLIQRVRSSNPASSLACLYALSLDAAERQVLGPEVAIDITAIDETNTRIREKEIIAQVARHDCFGMVGLVGVQSNQFRRSVEIARPLRAAGLPVVISGSPVTGRLPMLADMQADVREALDMGCSLFDGDAENGRIDVVIRDAAKGALQSTYNHVPALPTLESDPSPFVPQEALRRMIDHYASFDARRGCPFQCSFCTITEVKGGNSGRRLLDNVEQSIRAHYQQGVPWFFITDHNFARKKEWEQVFDRIILLRERDNIQLKIAMQVDMLSHNIPDFIAKAARAGVRKVFIGVENGDPANTLAAAKRRNRITEYRRMMLAWKKAGVITYAGYICGLPGSASASVREDIEINKQTPPTDILQFFCYAAASSMIRSAIPMQMKRSHPRMS